jgi:hypothetical protein
VSRPERTAGLALALALVALSAGCGKSNLVRAGGERRASQPVASGHPAKAGIAPLPVPIPVRLTFARAGAFARAVNLTALDVPGSHRTPRTRSPESQQEESTGCSTGAAQPVGGGRSATLDRGRELETESISSSVIVLPSAAAARADLAYADSRAGLACSRALLRHKLARESSALVRVGHVSVARLSVGSPPGPQAHGLRIETQISGRTGITIGLYLDAIGFDYGPAEIELYATSFVQPIATKTENELLALMLARARLTRL